MKTIKKILLVGLFPIIALTMSSCTDYQDEVDALDVRVTNLENLVKKVNNDLQSLSVIVKAFEEGDIITDIKETPEGYIINFANNDPIFIRDGVDGEDAKMPDITIEQDPTDGVYYWKVNGVWVTDPSGKKVRADGKNGKDGTTPQLKIEDGYWYYSMDGGTTWQPTGTAASGKDGKDANPIVNIVVHLNEKYVEFTTSTGTTFRLPLK